MMWCDNNGVDDDQVKGDDEHDDADHKVCNYDDKDDCVTYRKLGDRGLGERATVQLNCQIEGSHKPKTA